MSILIKNESVPDNCMDCKMADIEKWYKCPFYPIMKENYSDKRFEKCPLIEVPEPHGRLIDADALSKKAYHRQTLTTVADMLNDINDAPTVIEAEGK